MSYADSANASNTFECIRFVANQAATLQLSARGATVARVSPGIYLVTLAQQNQCDVTQRTILLTVGSGTPSLAQADVSASQTDQTFRIFTFSLQGSPADTEAEITVEVTRAVNVG